MDSLSAKGNRVILRSVRGVSASAAHVAALAGARVVERAKAVRGQRGGGRRHPKLVKHRLAQPEIETGVDAKIGGGLIKGQIIAAHRHCGGPGGAGLKRLAVWRNLWGVL